MPQAILSAKRVGSILGRSISPELLEPVLFRSKAEIARWDDDQLVIDATPDRIDLLTEAGLAMHLAGGLGVARGIVTAAEGSDLNPETRIEVDASTRPLRPSIAGVIVAAPSGSALDADLLSEAIRFQELLHATRGADRRVGSLGIYPWERLVPPIRYAAEPLATVEFVPLGGETPMTGERFFAEHPLALQYGRYGRTDDLCLTLRDGRGTLLSLPPILNTRSGGEARPGDKVLLLESTGLRASAVQDLLGLLLEVFVVQGWSTRPVRVLSPEGEDPGTDVLGPRELSISSHRLEELSGVPWSAPEVEHRLAEVRLGGHPSPHGWKVMVPSWRPDLQTETDVAEDLILARGVLPEDALIAPATTRGRRLSESRFRARVGSLLLGLGFFQLHTPVLTARETVRRLGRPGAVALSNPPTELYAVFRHTLLLSLLTALERNVRFGYPQRVHEIGPVVVKDPAAETGAQTRIHAAAVVAADRAGFSDGAALLDYVLSSLGASGVREPAEIAGTIPGRAAIVRLAGERVGEVGEVHPRLLSAIRVPVPAVWAELDLTSLWPLMRRDEAA